MTKVQIFILTIAIIVIGIVGLAVSSNNQTKKDNNPVKTAALQQVADALTSSGTKFFGASWCPHCAEQKSFFAKAVKSLPYIECSTGGAGTPQTQICIDNKIESYPTWEFTGGKRVTLTIVPLDLATIIGTMLSDEAKAELTIQKDEFLVKMNPAQKEAYEKQIESLTVKK